MNNQIDLHGLKHGEVPQVLDQFLWQMMKRGESEVLAITGISTKMKALVYEVCRDYNFSVTEVSDMRDLEPAEGITKVGEIKESRDPSYDAGTRSKIYACIVELFDLDFELNGIDYKIGDLARETETQYFAGEISENEELKISLRKQINKIWTGNMLVKCKFDVDGITSKRVSTLRGQGPEMDKVEKELFDLVEEISAKIINILDYRFGQFSIMWGVSGSAMPYNSDRTINIDIDFILNNNASMLPFWT